MIEIEMFLGIQIHVTIAWKFTCKKEMQPSNCKLFPVFTSFQHVCARLKKNARKLQITPIRHWPYSVRNAMKIK